jgi:membrane-associated protease RseP (regulator of RpoE activity)
MRRRGAELLDVVGPAILITSSAAGPAGWLIADARPNLVQAVVALEPLGPSGPVPLPWGLSASPITYDPPAAEPGDLDLVAVPREAGGRPMRLQADPPRRLPNLADLPIAVVSGEQSFANAMDDGTVGANLNPPPLTWPNQPVAPTRESLAEPWLGAQTTGLYSDALASSVGLSGRDGIYLASVPTGSAAANAGLRAADVIRSVNGTALTQKNSFWTLWNQIPANSPVQLGIWRNQSPGSLTITRPGGVERINNTSGVAYTGSGWAWKDSSSGGAGNWLNEIDVSSTAGDSFTLAFHGTGLKMITETYADETTMMISVDNGPERSVNLSTPGRVYQTMGVHQRREVHGCQRRQHDQRRHRPTVGLQRRNQPEMGQPRDRLTVPLPINERGSRYATTVQYRVWWRQRRRGWGRRGSTAIPPRAGAFDRESSQPVAIRALSRLNAVRAHRSGLRRCPSATV